MNTMADVDDELKEKMAGMGEDLAAVCQDYTCTMKKRGVLCRWYRQWKDDEHTEYEQSIRLTYYEFDSLNHKKINTRKLIVSK